MTNVGEIRMNPIAREHFCQIVLQFETLRAYSCDYCGKWAIGTVRYCTNCGSYLLDHIANKQEQTAFEYNQQFSRSVKLLDPGEELARISRDQEFSFPKEGIYVIYCADGWDAMVPRRYYKVGFSDNIPRRMNSLSTGSPHDLQLIHVIETTNLNWTEQFIHTQLAKDRVDPGKEWFCLDLTRLEWLLSIERLDPPKNFASQHSILNILESFPGCR